MSAELAQAPTAGQQRRSVFQWRTRMQGWFESRLAFSDTVTLTQRNVYILPTRPGLMMALTLLVLLICSINYQLNLGYLLTFLLAGSSLVGMHVCHGTLRGLSMHLLPPQACFAQDNALLKVQLINARRQVRHSVGLCVIRDRQWSWTDVPAQGQTQVQIAFGPVSRGRHLVPTLSAETRFPMGTFRVWTVWRPASSLLVYPAPEPRPPPLPQGQPRNGQATHKAAQNSDEADGIRPYRRGDPVKLIAWKKAAQTGDLATREYGREQGGELWLDLAVTGSSNLETGLSRLCAWVLAADRMGLNYGLRIKEMEIAPSGGEAHRHRCLEALATC